MAKSKRTRGRRLLDFPMASPRAQYAQGLVKGLPHLERGRSRQLEQQRYEDAQGRRQEDIDRRLSELDEKKLQGAADAVMDFLTKKDVAPETRERILDQLPDQIKKRMPFMPEGELYKPEDPLFEEAKRRKAEDVLEELRPSEEREQERVATEKEEEKAEYKTKINRAKEIAQDDTLTAEGRVIAIKQIGLRSGDEKFYINRAKIAKKPRVYKGTSPESILRSIAEIDNQLDPYSGTKDQEKIKWYKKQRAMLVKRLEKAQGGPSVPPPPPAPPLTPEEAPSVESNEQTSDSEKVWQEIYNDLDAQGKAMADALLAKGKSKQEIMHRLGY